MMITPWMIHPSTITHSTTNDDTPPDNTNPRSCAKKNDDVAPEDNDADDNHLDCKHLATNHPLSHDQGNLVSMASNKQKNAGTSSAIDLPGHICGSSQGTPFTLDPVSAASTS